MKHDFETKIRYAVTHVNRDNMRTLTGRNVSHNHFDTTEAAREYIAEMLKNNTPALLADVYGPQALGTFEVRPVECYMHGDAIGIYFDV